MSGKSESTLHRGAVRQTDVARAAGVSTATVSRVMNGSPLVRPKARERVEAAIRDLGYLPHEGARSLATRRSRTLGAIVPTLNNAIFAAGLDAFEAAARARGYGLVISVSNYDSTQEDNLVRQMIERGVDGLLLVGNDRPAAARELLAQAGRRALVTWAHEAGAALPNAGFDNAAAMAPVVDHLVAAGRRRIAVLAGITAGNDRARARVAGVRTALARHGRDLAALAEVRYSVAAARMALPELLPARPDAIVCGNDVIAYGMLAGARAAGIDVPGDLAVTGFDDLPLSAELAVPLTSVAVPTDEMGSYAADELIAAVEEARPVRGRQLGVRLVVRASSAA